MKKIKPGRLVAVCTWGDGPDVILVNDNKHYLLYDKGCRNHYSMGGSFDLNVDEAKALVEDLKSAIQMCEELDWLSEKVELLREGPLSPFRISGWDI